MFVHLIDQDKSDKNLSIIESAIHLKVPFFGWWELFLLIPMGYEMRMFVRYHAATVDHFFVVVVIAAFSLPKSHCFDMHVLM